MPETIGIDQYGTVHRNLGAHPRKELMKRAYTSHAQKMYRDTATGPKHIGYVIRGRWITLYDERQGSMG